MFLNINCALANLNLPFKVHIVLFFLRHYLIIKKFEQICHVAEDEGLGEGSGTAPTPDHLIVFVNKDQCQAKGPFSPPGL